ERLIYRIPSERLVLSVQTDKDSYRPGERVRLTLMSRTEKAEPEPAWLLVSVVNQETAPALADGPTEPTGLPMHFYLANEVSQPEDLERADFLLSDHPDAARALDLFLGTQGWRRFLDPRTPPALAQSGGEAKPARLHAEETPLVKLDNTAQVERKAE